MFVRIVFNSCSFWSTVETLWICLLSHSEFSFAGPTDFVCCMQYPRIRTCGWIRQISLFFVWSVCYVHGLKPPTNSTQSMMGLGLFLNLGKPCWTSQPLPMRRSASPKPDAVQVWLAAKVEFRKLQLMENGLLFLLFLTSKIKFFRFLIFLKRT